ncbi:DNA-processing protein DprA [Nocardia nova]|nr:DNA-processing protein DprA [Nocardia nova]
MSRTDHAPDERFAPLSPARRLAWAIAARAALIDSSAVSTLLAHTDVEEIAERLSTEHELFQIPPDVRNQAVADLDRASAVEAMLLTPDDPDWPIAAVADLERANIAAPVALWVRGPVSLTVSVDRTVGVTGSRAASDYGMHVAHDVATYFADRGWRVLSGAGYGIDTAAHRAALLLSAPTIAVVAAGIDRAYPAGNARLFDQLGERGLIVSEYPPGSVPTKPRFPERNRLVAALSAGLVICEAGARSGSLDTASWARRLRRRIAAVPGSIYSATSAGCHKLLREHTAHVATSGSEALDVVTDLGAGPAS